MSALEPSQAAPEFELQGLDGTSYSSRARTPDSLLLAIFFKTTCPTSQFTLPYVERLYRQYPSSPTVRIWGVSQDGREETMRLAQEYDLTFPILLDTEDYDVSTQYHLTHVPTIFLIDGNGTIQLTSVGFFKNDWLEISRIIAARLGVEEKSIFLDGENIPRHQYG